MPDRHDLASTSPRNEASCPVLRIGLFTSMTDQYVVWINSCGDPVLSYGLELQVHVRGNAPVTTSDAGDPRAGDR